MSRANKVSSFTLDIIFIGDQNCFANVKNKHQSISTDTYLNKDSL